MRVNGENIAQYTNKRLQRIKYKHGCKLNLNGIFM